MEIEFTPMLQIQRNLYAMPRGIDRFRAYLREMIDPEVEDLRLPLVHMNPMGKDHLPALLDAMLAMQAEEAAMLAARESAAEFPDVPGAFKFGLVLVDDVAGGWTNRYAVDFGYRFENDRLYDRGWQIALVWASDTPSIPRIQATAKTAIYRLGYIKRHGRATKLRERAAQEGWAMAHAGCTEPRFEPDELDYTRQAIEPHWQSDEMSTTIACLFGDAAARTLGMTPRGLSADAGLAVALHDAKEAGVALLR
jgi:hypothetical protein